MNKINLIGDTINNNDIQNLILWLQTNPKLTKGEQTWIFEKQWSEWLGRKYSVYVNSGSSANLLMLHSLYYSGLLNNKVVVPSLCWATDLAPIIQTNLKPILCDCNLENLSVDLECLERIFKEFSPKLFICVSILGFSPDMTKIIELCNKYNVILVEDVCESMGSTFNNQKLGTFGEMSSFSMFFGHHISTIEGGMISTDNLDLYRILLSIRNHGWGRDWDNEYNKKMMDHYQIDEFQNQYTFYYPGFNVRSTDLQAKIGQGQILKLPELIAKRNKNFNYYQANIKNNFWKIKPLENSFTSNFAYPILSADRMKLVKALKDNNIETRPLVCGSMKNQPFFKNFTINFDIPCPNCDIVDKHGLYLPNHPDLIEEDLKRICDVVNSI